VASVLYYLLLTAALIFFLWRVTDEVSQDQLKQRLAIAALSGLLLIDHLERELHLGNINLFLLILLFEVYRLLIRKKDWQAGALYGLILLFKPHFLLLLPYLLWKRKLRAAGATVLSVIIGLLLPALGVGWNENLRLLQFWGFTIGDHNVALQHSPNTFYGLMNHAFLGGVAGPILIVVVLALVAAGIAGWLIYNDRRHGKTLSTDIRYEEYFLLIGLVPNLVHTDTEHFMWVWPMLVLAVCAALNTKANYRVAIICLLALAFIPFAVNSPDIVGKHWQLLFDEGGLGVANVLILVAAMIVARSENHSIRLTA
jgi:hypothetical protein